jgi:hypothetical protein
VISLTEPRCLGKPAGPTGHQHPPECHSCARRLAHRAWGTKMMEAPKETPCPARIAEVVDV